MTVPRTDDYAIIVGLNNYRNGLDGLDGPTNDATNFFDWVTDLRDGGAVPQSNVVKIWEGSGESTDYITIQDKIKAVCGMTPLVERDTSRERLYVFMAGHGINVRQGPGARRETGTALLSLDCYTQPYQSLGQHFAAAIIIEIIESIRCYKEVFLIMDCCREIKDSVSLNNFWNSTLRRTDENVPRIYTFYAADVGQLSREEDIGGQVQGKFTNSLVNNLRSAADNTGQVTFSSLKRAVLNDFKNNSGQSPSLWSPDDEGENIVISKPATLPKIILTIDFGPYLGSSDKALVVGDGVIATINLLDQVGPYKIEDLAPGHYSVILTEAGKVEQFLATPSQEAPHVQF